MILGIISILIIAYVLARIITDFLESRKTPEVVENLKSITEEAQEKLRKEGIIPDSAWKAEENGKTRMLYVLKIEIFTKYNEKPNDDNIPQVLYMYCDGEDYIGLRLSDVDIFADIIKKFNFEKIK